MLLPSVVEPWLWPAFIVSVLVLLAMDLFVFHRESHVLKFKEAVYWSIFWVSLAGLFTLWFGWKYGHPLGIQFLTGYLVELSLSVDNLFVILLIFQSFKINSQHQHRVLFWGILGAIVFRGILIIVGVDLIHKFHAILYFFGAILIYSAVKFLFETEEKKDVLDSYAVKLFKKIMPVSSTLDGQKFFIHQAGRRYATPLLLALFVIEISDIVFAVDSIPAVLSITHDAFIAFGSNILAILGLRSLYFIVVKWVEKFRYLKAGLACILAFVGIKMLLSDFITISPLVSLGFIVAILFTAGLTSWNASREKPNSL